MELLESVGPRPRQARYQAALRPDMKCAFHSKALSNFVVTPLFHFWSRLYQNYTRMPSLDRGCPFPVPFHSLDGSILQGFSFHR